MKPQKVLSLVAGLLVLCGCSVFDDSSPSKGDQASRFELYYPDITEICPGTDININPNSKGTLPELYEISEIRFEGVKSEFACFSVEDATGSFWIRNSTSLEFGNYEIDIRCIFPDKSSRVFSKAIGIRIMKPVPDGITVTPNVLKASAADISTGTVELPTAQVSTEGEGFVKVKGYAIQNVYRDGVLDNDCKEWFQMDPETGVFSIVSPNNNIIPGRYVFDLKLTTYKVGMSDEEGIYASALTVDAVSAPYELIYTPSLAKVEVGLGGSSAAPVCKGTPDNLVFEIDDIFPDNEVGITIDPATGVLTFPAPSADILGWEYMVTVKATNDYGSQIFYNALVFRVISYIAPITSLKYGDITGKITGLAFSNAPSEVAGDELTFSFVDLPEELSALTINPETGVVSCAKGKEIKPGTYTVKVNAKNVKSEMTASFTLDIIPNPNNFTYVLWGNNMGLTPTVKYGNQFRIEQGTPTAKFSIIESDIPQGKPVSFAAEKLTAMGGCMSVSKSTGELTITAKPIGSSGANIYIHYYRVAVTVGTGEEAVTRYFPVFIQQIGHNEKGIRIEYTPFVLHFSPKSGGRSTVPVVTNKAGEDCSSSLVLDMETNFYWFNVNDPMTDKHPTGRMHSNDANFNINFLRNVYNKYYTAIGKPANYGSYDCWSAYNAGLKGIDLSYLGAYVDQTTHEIVVNPEKFVDQYGYGDGVLAFCCGAVADGGTNPHATSGSSIRVQVYPVIIWLDINLNE